jgi:hypothetical protein
VKGYWNSWCNEELHDLYSWPNIMRAIKSRGMIVALHVARMGERERNVAHRVFGGGNLRRDNLKYLCVDGSVILKLVFNK